MLPGAAAPDARVLIRIERFFCFPGMSLVNSESSIMSGPDHWRVSYFLPLCHHLRLKGV